MCSASLTNFKERTGSQCDTPSLQVDDCVDLWPVVAPREFFYDTPQHIAVDDINESVMVSFPFAEVGDLISISLLGHPELKPSISSNFGLQISTDGHATLTGCVVAIWTVHHVSRKGSAQYSSAKYSCSPIDKKVIETFSFVEYRSPRII